MKLFRAIVIAFLLFSLLTMPLLAIADPDTYTLDSFQAYQLDDGSQVYLITYTLDYTSAPNQTATEAWLFRLSDNGVNIAETTPTSFVSSGYTSGCVGFYFRYDDADLPTWGTANVTVNMTGNPSLSWDGGDPPIRANVPVESWNDGQSLLEARIRFIARALESPLSLDLVEIIGGVYRLTEDGEMYFETAIPSLRTVAPNVFYATTSVPELIDHSYNNTYKSEIESTWSGNTTFGNFDDLASQFGLSRTWLLTGLWTALSAGIALVLAINMQVGRGSLFIFGCIMAVGSAMGFASLTAGILLGVLGFLAIGYSLLWRGSP